MNKAEFFNHIRKINTRTFSGRLSGDQVSGIEAILDAGHGYPLSHLAYALATARGEVGPGMRPREENLNYSASRIPQVFGAHRRQGIAASKLARNPELLANTVYGGEWGAENLGNTQDGDGWRFRGRGLPMVTGRANYEKLAAITGLDLVGIPELMLETDNAAKASLLEAMRSGIYTGKRFNSYLPEDRAGTLSQFTQARRIINGQFHADKIAAFAMDFQAALVAAGYNSEFPATATTPPATVAAEPDERTSLAQSTTMQASVAQIGAAVTAGGTAVSALDGTAQIIAITACVVIALAALWIMRERVKKWAGGVR